MLPAQPNQSLIDGLACLQALATAVGPIGSRQMARDLGMEPTRVNRLLKTLAHLGIAQQTADRQYVPGSGMHVLAAQAIFGSGLLRRATQPLNHLRRHKLSIALGVLWRDQVSYLYHASPGTSDSEAIGRVGLYPATRSSIGLVLLSQLPTADVRALYRTRSIPNYPEGMAALLADLAAVQQSGFAVVRPDEAHPTRTVAVAIPDSAAAIALSGAIADGALHELHQSLRDAAERIAVSPST
ncbi:MAG TPA: helix-turn-helix domain-containing protein [Tepidisphaeraceae bacterium]|jgi:DNA-binding IclR family transcriptional regulator|nr:helix-turn-helix domain-containing protein [Tepidisphaeraceae bacterium]